MVIRGSFPFIALLIYLALAREKEGNIQKFLSRHILKKNHVCVLFQIYKSLTSLITLITFIAELDCCLFTWRVNSANFSCRSLVIAVILSMLSLNTYTGCEGKPIFFSAAQVSRLCWSSVWFLHSLHFKSCFPCLKLFLTPSPLVLAAKRNRFSSMLRVLSDFRYFWRLRSL